MGCPKPAVTSKIIMQSPCTRIVNTQDGTLALCLHWTRTTGLPEVDHIGRNMLQKYPLWASNAAPRRYWLLIEHLWV